MILYTEVTVRFIKKSITVLLIGIFIFSDLVFFLYSPAFLSIPSAHASTGDFSIFRENTGTETVDSSVLDISWDTTVQSNANIALQANSSDIDLTDGGKYLVLYNIWTEQGTSTAGNNRRSHHSWLTLAGNELAYGHGGGYLRDSDNTLYAYNSGSAIIDANAGDDLQVHVQRDDANTSAGMNIRPDTNGVSILKLKDGWDYLRIRKSATSSNINGDTSFTDVTWDTSDEVDTGSFSFTPTSGDITLKGDDNDHFLVTANVRLNRTSNNTRENYEMILTLDGVEIPGTRVTSYIRGSTNGNNDFNDTLVYNGIVRKDTIGDQTLNLKVRRESSGGGGTTVIMGDQAAVSIVALPDEGSYIMLVNGSDTPVASTQTAMDWDTQQEVDTAAFSHSTSADPSRISINQAGDYLFFSTAYATVTTDDRQPFRIDWRKNGSTQFKYGSFGAYIRSNSTFSGGSSGGLIMDGLSQSDYIEITQFDETEAPIDTTFNAGKVALQGVLLDQNFFGTDVLVSASGTHTTLVDIPATDVYGGGSFVVQEKTSTRNVTNITVTESGTVDGSEGLGNIRLYYDLDTTGADNYDCSSESYNGTEAQFGSTDTNGFSGTDGVSSFSGSVSISTTQSMCVYVVYDVTSSSSDSDTVVLSIENASTDVSASGGASIGPVTSVQPSGSTVLQNAELTQIHYHWRNDDGSETTATSIDGTQDTPAIGFANGTTRRLRYEISAEGSTSSKSVSYRLEYAQKVTTCDAVVSWTDVGFSDGGDWDIVNTPNLTDGNDTTNISVGSGGVTDENTTFLTTNGGQKDTSSQTGAITLTSTEFLELEFALQPTAGAPQGNTYCFRLSNVGEDLRNYNVYAEGTISADIDVSAYGTQTSSIDAGSTSQYVGGSFVVQRSGSSRTLTDITITETGTIDASVDLANPTLYFDLDTTAPYDCVSESYAPTDGSVSGSAFTGANGSSTFTGSVAVSSTQTFCGYVVFDVSSGASNGESINIEISDPSVDVVVTGSSVGPSTAVSPSGSTTVSGPVRSQMHFHWRNDDGDETDGVGGASSATAGIEDTPILSVPKDSIRRLRIEVSNEGSVVTGTTQYQLEYGTKVTTCDAVGSWNQVGTTTEAFVVTNTPNLTDGNDTTNISVGSGGVTDENTTFLTTNGGQKDTSSQTGAITLTSTEFLELEFALRATSNAGDDTTYCFRLTDNGTDLEQYDIYPELTTREKQDFYTQTGIITFTGTSTTLIAGVDYVAPSSSSSAFFRIANSQITGAGTDIDVDTTQNADDVTAFIENPENIETSITIARPTTASASTTIAWEIVEFIGVANTDNEMIVRDQGTVTYGASSLAATGTAVSTIADDSDVVVFITGQLNPDTGTGYYTMLSTSQWNATSGVPVFTRGDTGGDAVQLSYAVVEFTGANWKIQRVEHVYTSDSVAETESITALNSINHAFIHAQKRNASGESGLEEMGHEVWLSSVGAVSFQLDPGANTPANHTSVAWVIENTQSGVGAMEVYQSNGTLGSGNGACSGTEPCTEYVSIGGTLSSANNASLFFNNRSDGNGTAYPRPVVAVLIISTTQYETWRSDTGQPQNFRAEVVQWPVAEVSIRQNYYRFYVDNDALDPTDPWPLGVVDLGENTSITAIDDPLGESERIRIRMSLKINNASVPENVKSFKLQFGKRDTTCSAINTWIDLGDPGSGAVWRGYSNSVSDGTALATDTPAFGTLNISVSDVAGTFESQNNSAVNPYAIDLGQDVEYDWLVEHNGATQLSEYCFRMVESDGAELNGYNNYPTLRTTGYTPVIGNWRWFDDSQNLTPTTTLANENTAPSDVQNSNEIKLRVTATEVEGAPGTNIKFALQYSQYSDFSDGGIYVHASSSCKANSIWCYTDAAGDDNATIDSAVLSDADSCVSGVGNGCGTHNEAATTTSSKNQPALSSMEFEFALKHAGARANGVYYFRLYDVTNDVALVSSSSYPSLVTEGAGLVFTLSGLPLATTTEGIVTDVATTPDSVTFGSVPFGTPYEAAQRISVDTNATQGYRILKYARQNLLNTYAEAIPNVTGTNEVPVGWSVGCSVSATGCFGYHAGDDTLDDTSTRFAADDSYAAFDVTPQEIMYSSVPAAESSDIVYKLQITNMQPAGEYQTEIVYIAVPTF